MDLVGGFVAPEDLVVATDGFGGEHQPIGVGIAGVGTPGRGDVEGGSALEHHCLAVAAAVQEGVAFRFDLAVIIENRAGGCCLRADGIAQPWIERNDDGFVRLYFRIGARIDCERGCTGSGGESDETARWGEATGICIVTAGGACAAAEADAHGEGAGGGSCSG